MKLDLTSFFCWEHLTRWYHTLQRLQFEQLFYRLYYPIKRKIYVFIFNKNNTLEYNFNYFNLSFSSFSVDKGIYQPNSNTIHLLNLPKTFGAQINWDFQDYGLLWQFHLHYFDWLNDIDLNLEDALGSLFQFIENHKNNYIFTHSYPTSIRIINWIKFVQKHRISHPFILQNLWRQIQYLSHFPEYEIGGNHLLTNAVALTWGGVVYNHPKITRMGVELLEQQLDEQFLDDGVHYEKSFAYQSILLRQLLELYSLMVQQNRYNFLLKKMKIIILESLYKLSLVTMKDGSYPNFGDSNREMSIPFDELNSLAQSLGILIKEVNGQKFSVSGYKFFDVGGRFQLIMNSGNVCAHYQPGHYHADALSFCLGVDGGQFIVDRGVSTYDVSPLRAMQRATISHNTVAFGGLNSTEVWRSFRVGKSASVFCLDESAYKADIQIIFKKNKNKFWHKRSIHFQDNAICIEDEFSPHNQFPASAFLHFHPSVAIKVLHKDTIIVQQLRIKIDFEGCCILEEDYLFCEGFNKTSLAKRVIIEPQSNKMLTKIATYY